MTEKGGFSFKCEHLEACKAQREQQRDVKKNEKAKPKSVEPESK